MFSRCVSSILGGILYLGEEDDTAEAPFIIVMYSISMSLVTHLPQFDYLELLQDYCNCIFATMTNCWSYF